MRISDWSSDVCSSDLRDHPPGVGGKQETPRHHGIAADIEHAAAADTGVVADVLRIAVVIGKSRLDRLHLAQRPTLHQLARLRSAERRVGKDCVSKCISRWSPFPYTKKKITYLH